MVHVSNVRRFKQKLTYTQADMPARAYRISGAHNGRESRSLLSLTPESDKSPFDTVNTYLKKRPAFLVSQNLFSIFNKVFFSV